MLGTDRRARGQEAAEALAGSCCALDEVLTQDEQDDPELMETLGELVFCCPECGWWCPSDEESEDGRCLDCNPEEDES